MKRVSRRLRRAVLVSLVGRKNCLITTVPVGKCQLFVGEKTICSAEELYDPSLGTASQRCFTARSDQNGEFTVYGIKVFVGARVARFVKTPNCESKGGGSGTEAV